MTKFISPKILFLILATTVLVGCSHATTKVVPNDEDELMIESVSDAEHDSTTLEATDAKTENVPAEAVKIIPLVPTATQTESDKIEAAAAESEAATAVKEFSIDSFVEVINEEFLPQFSVKEIMVKKGDRVRIKVNTTSGRHDFKIDEFDVFADTPTGEVTVIEFIADQVGEFVYYCNQPRHRDLGQWGTLIVTE